MLRRPKPVPGYLEDCEVCHGQKKKLVKVGEAAGVPVYVQTDEDCDECPRRVARETRKWMREAKRLQADADALLNAPKLWR